MMTISRPARRAAIYAPPLLYTVTWREETGELASIRIGALGMGYGEAERVRDRILGRHPDWDMVIVPLGR